MTTLTDDKQRLLRPGFEQFIHTWHSTLVPELTTWNEYACFYTNLEINNLFRAYSYGALGTYKNKGK
jgi:hypothetical protein